MHNIDFILVELIQEFLGKPRTSIGGENRVQWEFNCPSKICSHDDYAKFNLNYQSEKKIFRCWKCNYKGIVHRLVRDYGGKDRLKRLNILFPKEIKTLNIFQKPVFDHTSVTCELPSEFIPLTVGGSRSHADAVNYALEDRKIPQRYFDKFNLGYCEYGRYGGRIIIPSYNANGKLNFFEARDFTKRSKKSYVKPKGVMKSEIIFNESNINWDLPIYLVEGPFDMFSVDNSIPMLGKIPSDLLIWQLSKKAKKVVICTDEDAFRDGNMIYKKLSSLGVDVYFVDLSGYGDLSNIREKHGMETVKTVLKAHKKINDSDLMLKELKKA